MEYEGRLTKQINKALLLLEQEGSIIIPMNEEQYQEGKKYKFCILEEIHEIQKNINYSVQRNLFEEILNKVKDKYPKYDYSFQTGVIRLI